MSEKLTKTALKAELQRRMDWFESRGINTGDPKKMTRFTLVDLGRYYALSDMKFQIERNLFIGGFAA